MVKLDEPVGIYEDVQAKIDVPAEVQTFVGRKIPRGHVLKVEEAAITDLTTANTLLCLGKRDATGQDHWIKCQTGANTHTCNLVAYPILKECEQPIARVTTPTVDDDLYFTIYGWLYKYP